jgi:hypothetical protein
MLEIFGNITANDTVRWQPEPTTRGTFGVLSSCLITISLYIWTAVHLNVLEHNGEFRQLLRKEKWLLIGLLAPEMVLFTAWYQRVRARETAKMVSNNLGKVRRGEDGAAVSQEWVATSIHEGNVVVSVKAQPEGQSSTEQTNSTDGLPHKHQSELAPLPMANEAQGQTREKGHDTEEYVGDFEPDLERDSKDEKLEVV